MSKPMTKQELAAGLQVLMVLADTIKELKQVPSGELYTRVMQHLSIDAYEGAIRTLVGSKVIRKENHLLIWNVS